MEWPARATLRQHGSSSEFRTDPQADNFTDEDRSTVIWLEIPDNWSDFEAAAHVLQLPSTEGPVATMYGKWLYIGAGHANSLKMSRA